jgi:predicted outer membrane protein
MSIFLRRLRAVTLALALLAAPAGIAACGSSPASQPASVSAARLSSADLNWLNQAHQANMAEVTAGQFAVSNATTAGIRSVGATLVHQHALFDGRLVEAATKLNVNLVTYLTTAQALVGDRLSKETGAAFDHDFTASMMTAHQQMIGATEKEIRDGSSPQVELLAQQALPMLEMHLKMLRAVANSG